VNRNRKGSKPTAKQSITTEILRHYSPLFVVVIVLMVGAYQHCSHEGLLYSNPPMEFRHSSPEALHTKRRERPLLAKDGTQTRKFSCQFVIHEITRFFYKPQSPPKEGMLEDFYHTGKIQRHRPGLNPRTRVPEASMLTTRPPKPSVRYLRASCLSLIGDEN
jgi:hypothetical protein